MSEQQVYEIVNPSDNYTIKGPVLPCAVGVLLLGDGNYVLVDHLGETALPPFLTEDGINDWLREHAGTSTTDALGEYMDANRIAIADALDTVLIGGRKEYEARLTAVPDGEREAFREQWHDEHRTSMNDIGKRARAIAARLRELEAAREGATK